MCEGAAEPSGQRSQSRTTSNELFQLQDDKAPLTVEQRTEIALDTVRAIHYLHTYEDEPMIHRDVKRYYSTWAYPVRGRSESSCSREYTLHSVRWGEGVNSRRTLFIMLIMMYFYTGSLKINIFKVLFSEGGGHIKDCLYSVYIGVHRPAIVREIPHFGLFPAFSSERPAFLALFRNKKNR